jgi:hypothetical protein
VKLDDGDKDDCEEAKVETYISFEGPPHNRMR